MALRTVAIVLGVSLGATVLSACDPWEGVGWDLRQVLADDSQGDPMVDAISAVSTDRPGTSLGFVGYSTAAGQAAPGAQFVVVDKASQGEQVDDVKVLSVPLPAAPTSGGGSQLSLNGLVFVAQYWSAQERPAGTAARRAAPGDCDFWAPQILRWTRSSYNGEFGEPEVVSAGPDDCGSGGSEAPSTSADGASVAFVSSAPNLVEDPPAAGRRALYVSDGGTVQMVTPVSLGADVTDAMISGNGLHIVFTTQAAIVGGVAAGERRVYRASRAGVGQPWSFELVSRRSSGALSEGWHDGGSSISEDGSRVAFLSGDAGIEAGVESQSLPQLVVRDVAAGKTQVVLNGGGEPLRSRNVGGHPGRPQITADGKFVAIWERTSNETFAPSTDLPPTKVSIHGVDKVLSDTVADRSGAKVHAKSFLYGSNETESVAVSVKDGRAQVAFASVDAPSAKYADDGGALYVLSGAQRGAPWVRPWVGDPVDAATGGFSQDETDLVAPAGVAGPTLSRRYSSAGEGSGIFGPGWTTVFDARVEVDDNDATVVLPEGRSITFRKTLTGWASSSAVRSRLSGDVGSLTLTEPDGSDLVFDSDGRLAAMGWPGRSGVNLLWDDVAHLVEVSSEGYSVTLVDDTRLQVAGSSVTEVAGQDGLVDRAESSDGLVVEYGYALGASVPMLHTVSTPHRPGQPAGSVGLRTYELSGSLITRITDRVDATRERVVVENTYDHRRRVVEQVNETGDRLTFHYDRKPAPPAGLVAAPGFTTVDNEASGDRVVYQYGPEGQVLGITDANGSSVGRTWTGEQSASSTSRDGITTANTYDDAGRLETTTETKGAVTRTVASYTYVVAESAPEARTDQRVATATDAAGVTTTYVYDEAESGSATQPWKVEVPCVAGSLGPDLTCPASGRTATTMTYGTGPLAGLVTSVVDADGVQTDTAYDAATRRVASVTTHPTPTTTEVTSYDSIGPDDPDWYETDPAVARVDTVTGPGPDPAITITKYDAAGRVLEQRDPLYDGTTHLATVYEYWLTGDLKAVTDPAGHTTTYDTLRPGDPSWTEAPASEVTEVSVVTDPDGVETITKTDRSGDVVAEQAGDRGVPETLATTVHTYGTLGRLATSTDPAGVVTRYGYDVEGRVTQTSTGPTLGDPNHTTTNVYDEWGHLAMVTGPTSTDPDGATVRSEERYTYDEAGRMRTRIDGLASAPAEQLMTAYEYDAAGRMWRTIEHRAGSLDTADPFTIAPGDKVTETRYTLAGRTAADLAPPVDEPLFDWNASPGARAATRYGYDGAGRQVTVTDPATRTTTTAYDPAGRVHTLTTPAGRVTTFGYDAAGRQTTVTSPSGLPAGQPATVSTVTGYDARGSVISETDPHVPQTGVQDPSTRTFTHTPGGRLETATDALGRTVTYDYDARGNRISRTAIDDAGSPVVQSWTFDAADRLDTATAPPPRSGATPMTTTYDYDPTYGWLETVTDPTGRVETRSSYNTGAVKTQTWTQAGQPTVTARYWVNGRGWTTRDSNQQGTTTQTSTYGYDRAGQRTSASLPPDGTPQTLGYAWDLVGNVMALTHADGSVAHHGHTPTGEVSTIDLAASAAATPVPYASYDYDLDRIRTNEVLPGIGARSWTLDAAGRPTAFNQLLPQAGGGVEGYAAVLTWRPDGRLGSEQVNGGATATYGYDDAGQLTSVVGGPASGSWTYGTRGNRLTGTSGGVTTSYATNPNGSVAMATAGTKVSTFTYDDAGRRTAVQTQTSGSISATVSNTVDARGVLSAVETTASGQPTRREERLYDAGMRTVRSTVRSNGAVETDTTQVWDTNQAVPEVLDSVVNGFLAFRTDQGAENPIAFRAEGTPVWFQYDAHDSVIRATPSNTAIAGGPTGWSAFGEANQAQPFTHLGYRGERTTNQALFLRNRDYDTTTGQFLTQDPLDGIDGTPTVANPYHYTDNDPINQVDPLGLRAGDGAISGGQAGAACDSVGGRLVWWGDSGSRVCMEPGTSTGSSCWPPRSPSGRQIVMESGSCSSKYVEVTCARGPGFLDPICRNADTITSVLTVIAVGAIGVATGGLAVVAIGGSAGIAIPAGGGALALAGGGSVAGGGAIVLSPAAAGALTGTAAGLSSLIHLAQNAGGGSGPKPPKNFEPPTNAPRKAPTPSETPPGYSVRVGPKTADYPNGYWRMYNRQSQAVDPSTLKPPGNVTRAQFEARTHVPCPSGGC